MIRPDVWKTIVECLWDILAALEKNERIGEDAEMVQANSENCNSGDCDVD